MGNNSSVMFDSISDKFSSILRSISGKSKITEKNIQDAVEEIKIDEAMSVEASSVMTYDKAAQTLTIVTKAGVTITVDAASKASTDGFVSVTGNTVVINLAQMPADTYTVSMVSATESKIFKIVR